MKTPIFAVFSMVLIGWINAPDADAQERRIDRVGARLASPANSRAPVIKPSECALAFNSALANAHSFAELRSYFTKAFVERNTGTKEVQEFVALKRAYARGATVKSEKLLPDGTAEVWLDGYDAANKSAWMRLQMLPEKNYWRVENYKASINTNVDVMRNPAAGSGPPGRTGTTPAPGPMHVKGRT